MKEYPQVHQVQRVGWSGPVLIDDHEDVMEIVSDFLVEHPATKFGTLLIRKTGMAPDDERFLGQPEFDGTMAPPPPEEADEAGEDVV